MADAADLAQRFRSPAAARRFAAAYDELAGRWPKPLTALDVGGEFGTTHVLACGPAGGPPVVLLPSHGATAPAWFAVARALGAAHRVYAIDPVGDAGLSVASGRPARRPADLVDWLDGAVRPMYNVATQQRSNTDLTGFKLNLGCFSAMPASHRTPRSLSPSPLPLLRFRRRNRPRRDVAYPSLL